MANKNGYYCRIDPRGVRRYEKISEREARVEKLAEYLYKNMEDVLGRLQDVEARRELARDILDVMEEL